MKTITFYSYKGGVGRTLVVANVAFYLAQFGQKVVALDLDLEAPGLHYKLLPVSADQDTTPLRGVVDYLHHFIENRELPERIEDYLVQVPLRPSIAGSVHLMPAGAVPSPDYWHKLARLNWHDLFYSEDAPGIPLFLELKERIRAAYEPDFLLVDARTGITEIGGVATTVLPDQLVCLLLNNRENLEGARAVLRGIRNVPRPPGASSEVQVIPVLSRLPARDKPEDEQQVIVEVTGFLNSPAGRLEDTLELPEPFVLHADPALEVRERLLIATPNERGESPLLRDYLRLFGRLIPVEVVEPQLDAVIAQALGALLQDPDGAQRELENLARFSERPEVYRVLLQVYRLRNVAGPSVMSAAHRLWELAADPTEPLLWEAVKANLTTANPRNRFDAPLLKFVESVWRAVGANDIAIGTVLAESYVYLDQTAHAGDLLLELSENAMPHGKRVAQWIELLIGNRAVGPAGQLIGRFADQFANDNRFLSAWGKFLLVQPDAEIPVAIALVLENIASENAALAVCLARRTGDNERAQQLTLQYPGSIAASNHLMECCKDEVISKMNWREILDLCEWGTKNTSQGGLLNYFRSNKQRRPGL